MIAYAEVVRARRIRTTRAVHAACRRIITQSVESARAALVAAPVDERALHAARLEKLIELEAYATAIG